MSLTTLPRHARRVAEGRWAGRLVHRGLPRRPVAAGLPWVPPRHDPLAGPVAITEHCVIGDQIRVPAARCDMAGCKAGFADPGALGEADNRVRALAAGWQTDSVGRLVCPACQQRHGVTLPRPVPARQPDAAGGAAPAVARPGPWHGASRYVRAMLARWHGAVSPGRHGRAQWLQLLAALVNDSNGWNTPQPVTMPAREKTAPGPRPRKPPRRGA